MRYVGGKSRIAKHIGEAVLARRGARQTYVEPFMGGASILAELAPHFPTVIACDVVPDVALLWREAARGWVPPSDLTEDQYQALRRSTSPSAMRGFAGFGCSFGGKWFGGYARGKKPDGTPRNFVDEGARRIADRASRFSHATIRATDYRALTPQMGPDVVVYCDPPYAGTTGYDAAAPWDVAEFWATAEAWVAAGALVFVSEYAAPPDWVAVWEKAHRQSLQGGTAPRPETVERLFMHWTQADAHAPVLAA